METHVFWLGRNTNGSKNGHIWGPNGLRVSILKKKEVVKNIQKIVKNRRFFSHDLRPTQSLVCCVGPPPPPARPDTAATAFLVVQSAAEKLLAEAEWAVDKLRTTASPDAGRCPPLSANEDTPGIIKTM